MEGRGRVDVRGGGGGVKGKRERRGVEEWKRGEKKERWMGREGEE